MGGGGSTGGGAWHQTTAATSSKDILYAVQKGDLYAAFPEGSNAGSYTKISSGWGDTRCIAYLNNKLYIIWKNYSQLYLQQVDPVNKPNGINKGELFGSNARCMVSRGGRLYYVADSTLYVVDPGGGTPTVLTSSWDGATCMASLGDSLYIAAEPNLYRVDPDNGRIKRKLPGGYARNTTCMTSYNGYLYLVQDTNLYRVDGETGDRRYLSTEPGTWHHSTVMTAIPENLYIVQNGRLYRINPSNGEYTSLS
ncbi:MAG: hypothetical protein MJE68_18505 [Proteobacteria bacterium]|nr:hypothetical protein [Pseudomonadota bacterium]